MVTVLAVKPDVLSASPWIHKERIDSYKSSPDLQTGAIACVHACIA